MKIEEDSFKSKHARLRIWEEAMQLVTKAYEITRDFPRSELYSLVTQIRRSSLSIPLNIAEGAARKSSKEYLQFLYIARGSLSELEACLEISKRLNLINEDSCSETYQKLNIVGRMLAGLIRTIQEKTIPVSRFSVPD